MDDEKDFKFPDDFLDQLDVSREVDVTFISELGKLTLDQRDELTILLLQRDIERHACN